MNTKHTLYMRHNSDGSVRHEYTETTLEAMVQELEAQNKAMLTELEHVSARIATKMPEKHDDLTAVSVTFTGSHLATIRAIIAKATA